MKPGVKSVCGSNGDRCTTCDNFAADFPCSDIIVVSAGIASVGSLDEIEDFLRKTLITNFHALNAAINLLARNL